VYVRTSGHVKSPRKSVRVVESIREGFKVKQKMLLYVGVGKNDDELEKLKQIAREFIVKETLEREKSSKQPSFLDNEKFEERLKNIDLAAIEKQKKNLGRKPKITLKDVTKEDKISLAELKEDSRIIEGIHDVAGHVYDLFGYDQLLKRKYDQELLKDLVLMRLAEPSSKLKAQQMLQKRFSKAHGIDSIYRLMDKVFPKIDDIKTKAFNRTKALMPDTIDVLFFDCTTLYFESTETDEIRKFGYSKDHRFNTTQVVLALATNSDGLPIGYQLFEGNKAEVKTLLECLDSWKETLNIKSVCFVADRAMMSDANLTKLEEAGHTYIVAAKLRGMPKQLKDEMLLEKNYMVKEFQKNIGWVGEFEYKERRLIVSFKTQRARRDAHQRQQIVDKVKKQLEKSKETKNLLGNNGVKKYTKIESSTAKLDEDKIQKESQWDGFHGIITNIKDQAAVKLLGRYSQLWKIEESFRINKHTLSMRPIYHFKPERIKTHIAICYMAFSVLRHMEYTVQLVKKISPESMLDELMHVEASIYHHAETGNWYRMPGKFTQKASQIYKAFQLKRRDHAQQIIKNYK